MNTLQGNALGFDVEMIANIYNREIFNGLRFIHTKRRFHCYISIELDVDLVYTMFADFLENTICEVCQTRKKAVKP